jgi:hypothetical protein
MVMSVSVFQPQISVVLKKNIGRANIAGNIAASERFTGTARQIDLTPYLGDGGSVVTSKSTRQPAGMFSITLADNFAPGELESLYGVIEPMDVIEIRMARDVSKYAGAFTRHMPIMMRGFVTEVGRSEEMEGGGEDARPVRRVIITGQDYGKILQINQIAYLPNAVTGQLLLTYFKLFVNYGIGANPNQDASAFVSDVITKAVIPFLADMRSTAQASGVAQGISPIMDILVDAVVQGGVVSPFGANQWPGGTIYDLLAYYGDIGAWNELFIEDREDAPHLVYRPTPFKDATGKFVQEPYISTPSTRPTINVVSDAELVALKSSRTDAGVANYYWVDNPSYQLVQAPILQTAQSAPKDTFFLSDYPNSSPFLYGFRPMMVQTQQGGRFDGQKEAVFNAQQGDAVSFVAAKRATLMANNRDNVVFESGDMRLRGNEAIKAGSIVRLVRGGGFTAEYYAHTVQHEFVPFRSYVTTVSFDRGTGFIERTQHGNGADSPYLAEMSPGGVYG